MAEAKTTKAPAKITLTAVHGRMVNLLTGQVFEQGKPTEVAAKDSWLQSQIDAGKMTEGA